jgi:PPOX class probable F420-dependent enzyme
MRERVRRARVAVLGTVNEDGTPHLVPITFVLEGDVIYTAVDHKPKTTTRLKRLANIARDPRVTLLVQEYSDDWSVLWWVRLDGRAKVSSDRGEAIRALAAKYEQYRERPPSGPVIAVAPFGWTGWSATDETR